MKAMQESDVRQLHPNILELIGEEGCVAMLELARDLRSGVIPVALYDQSTIGNGCGTPCCILGHLEYRMGDESESFSKIEKAWAGRGILNEWEGASEGLVDLFSAHHPSDPQLAADAIERFVFNGAVEPWNEGGL